MNFKKNTVPLVLSSVLVLSGCVSNPPQAPVDLSSITEMEKFKEDKTLCVDNAMEYALTAEAVLSSAMGAVVGGSIVAGIAVIVAGTINPVALPFISLGTFTGAVGGATGVKIEENSVRESILKKCLTDKGYRVY